MVVGVSEILLKFNLPAKLPKQLDGQFFVDGLPKIKKERPQCLCTFLRCEMQSQTTLRPEKIEKMQSRLKLSISLEIFNPGASEFPNKIGVWWAARLKFSISLENYNPGGRS